MKKIKVIQEEFKRGELYSIDDTSLVPREFHGNHFRKPTFEEEGYYPYYMSSKKETNDMSEYDYCIKGIKIETKVYTN